MIILVKMIVFFTKAEAKFLSYHKHSKKELYFIFIFFSFGGNNLQNMFIKIVASMKKIIEKDS